MSAACPNCGETGISFGEVDCAYCRDLSGGPIAVEWLRNTMAARARGLVRAAKVDGGLTLDEAAKIVGEAAVFAAIFDAAQMPDEFVAQALTRDLGRVDDGYLRQRIVDLQGFFDQYGAAEGEARWLIRRLEHRRSGRAAA